MPGARLADAVVPVAYGVKGEQHYHDLVVYKGKYPAPSAQKRLRDLALLFLRLHWPCLTAVAGGPITHSVIVPSTRGRAGPHPLAAILAPALPIGVAVTSNTSYPASDRDLHKDRFRVVKPRPHAAPLGRVLLLDDTWTTGGRVQSLAHALKEAGASAVVAVVLGRLIRPEHGENRAFVARAARVPFDVNRCALQPCGRAARASERQ